MWILQARILGCYALLQGILPTQGSNLDLLHYRQILFFFFFNCRLNTILWWFLPYIDMNQPWVYMCSTILNTPSTSLPTPSLWIVLEHHLHALHMHRSSVLHMAIYMFQCYCLSHQGSPSIPTFNLSGNLFYMCISGIQTLLNHLCDCLPDLSY